MLASRLFGLSLHDPLLLTTVSVILLLVALLASFLPPVAPHASIQWRHFDMNDKPAMQFQEAVRGLLAGDFSRLAPLFDNAVTGFRCQIIQWQEAGRFANEPQALDEAFTCACFLGRTEVAQYFLTRGIDPSGGIATGLNAFHWAANRGQLEVVKLLIRHNAPLETRNSYGGTVLGGTVYAAIHEPRADHIRIIEALLEAGARMEDAEYPTGNERVDELLKRHGAAR